MPKLRGIASIILSQALLVLMLFQSANGGILVLVEENGPATELPIENETGDSETEISASLLSSPILNRGESNTTDSNDRSQDDHTSTLAWQLDKPHTDYFSQQSATIRSRPHETNLHLGSISALGP